MKPIKSTLFITTLIAAASASVQAYSQVEDMAYTGEIIMMATPFCPYNTFELRGQTIDLARNAPLYSIITTTFGGNGRTNFGLPDMQGRRPVHSGAGPGLRSVELGEKGGASEARINADRMPSHTHTSGISSHTHEYPAHTHTATLTPSTTDRDNPNPDGRTFPTYANAQIYSDDSPDGTRFATGSVIIDEATVQLEPYNVSGQRTNPSGSGEGVLSVESPALGMRYCLVGNGIYPPRR